MLFVRWGTHQQSRRMEKALFFIILLQEQQHSLFHIPANIFVDALALVRTPPDHHHHRRRRSPFVDEVTQWLMEQNQPFELMSDNNEHIWTKSSYMLHLPVPGGTTTTSMAASTAATPHKVVLGLHLLPTPTCLEECRGPRELLDMTNRHKSLYSCVPATANGPELQPSYYQYSKIIHLHQDVWEAKPDIVQSRLLMQMPSPQPQGGVEGEAGQDEGGVQATTTWQHPPQRRIMARKTQARKIPGNVAMEFLQTHHLWGATKAKHSYGLYYRPPPPPRRQQVKEGGNIVNSGSRTTDHSHHRPRQEEGPEEELVAVATFSNRHKITRCDDRIFQSHELLRFCTQRDMSVVGGISKLIKTFIRDKQPDDIVTVVDRDWGDGSGWHSVGFTTVATMDPIVMVVNPHEPGIRRHLVGAGIGAASSGTGTSAKADSATSRWGLPQDVLDELDTVDTAEQARGILARHNFFVVYDAGVERLFRIVVDADDTFTTPPLDVWHGSQPKYAQKYYSPNRGITALLEEAAAGGLEDYPAPTEIVPYESSSANRFKSDWLSSWQSTSGSAATAKLIASAPSSLNLNATIEVRERSNGWRTVSLIGGATMSIYHTVYKVNPETGEVEPEAIVSDYISVMAEGFLAVMQYQRATGLRGNHLSAPLRLLHLGLGGGTLLRLLAHKLEGCHQEAVELDEGVVAVVKSAMASSSGPSFEVHVGDALKIQRHPNELPWDGIFIDIFDENNLLPPPFYSPDYLRHLRDELMIPHRGVVVLNLHSGGKKRQREIDDAHLAFTQVFSSVRVISARDSKLNGGNLIMIGSMAAISSQ